MVTSSTIEYPKKYVRTINAELWSAYIIRMEQRYKQIKTSIRCHFSFKPNPAKAICQTTEILRLRRTERLHFKSLYYTIFTFALLLSIYFNSEKPWEFRKSTLEYTKQKMIIFLLVNHVDDDVRFLNGEEKKN